MKCTSLVAHCDHENLLSVYVAIFFKGIGMFLLYFTFPRSHSLSMRFSSLSQYCVILSYGLISDCKPGKFFSTLLGGRIGPHVNLHAGFL